jgi:hypothetical protein
MESPETEVTLLDENSYIKNLLEAESLAQAFRQMSGDYDIDDDTYDLVCEGCGRHLPCRHCAE